MKDIQISCDLQWSSVPINLFKVENACNTPKLPNIIA